MTATQISDRIRPDAEAGSLATMDVHGVRFAVESLPGGFGVRMLTRGPGGPKDWHRTELGAAATPEAAAELILAARENL